MLVVGASLQGIARGDDAPFPRPSGPVAPARPINTAFPGLTTFRGNASRSFYGEGPVPSDPVERWTFPSNGTKLCAMSAETQTGPKKLWCGTGWTGQPNVVPWKGGPPQVRIGAFDDHYHFLDAGHRRAVVPRPRHGRPREGVRDHRRRRVPPLLRGLARQPAPRRRDGPAAADRAVAGGRTHVGAANHCGTTTGTARRSQIDDYLLEGGENSWFYVIRLHRGYGPDGLVAVDPQIVATVPGWDDAAPARPHDPPPEPDVSIENSVAYRDGIVYFANSGGLVQGWDISDLLNGGTTPPKRVFRFWTGDDTDALGRDRRRRLPLRRERVPALRRALAELGQLMKLDPRRPDDPVVWSIPATEIGFEGAGGSWSTPALYGDYVYFTTAAGRVLEVERSTGRIVWEEQINAPTIASPVVVDGTLLQGDCSGHLYAWNVSDPTVPPPLEWDLNLGDCIESTPAVWHGWLYVGTREGFIYGIADADTPAPRVGATPLSTPAPSASATP